MKALKTLKIINLLLIFGLISCTNKLQFSTSVSPSGELDAIRTVAIGDVILLQSDEQKLSDQRGDWKVSRNKLQTVGLEKLIKRSLISNLSRFSDYNIVDLEVFSVIFSDKLNSIKPISGIRIGGIDAVLNLSVAVNVTTQNGQFDSVKSFSRRASRKSGKKWITTEDSSIDRKITEPYQTRAASVVLTGELLKVSDGKIILLSTFSETAVISIGSGYEPKSYAQAVDSKFMSFFSGDERSKEHKISALPFLGLKHETFSGVPNSSVNLTQRLALQISNMILPKFARYTVLATRTIDSAGNEAAVELLMQAKLLEAKEKLEAILANKAEKTAENIYNLGICYEALGEPRIAIQLYEEALELDQSNSNVIEALGALQKKSI